MYCLLRSAERRVRTDLICCLYNSLSSAIVFGLGRVGAQDSIEGLLRIVGSVTAAGPNVRSGSKLKLEDIEQVQLPGGRRDKNRLTH